LTLGQTYSYIVRAVHPGGVVSPASNQVVEVAAAEMVAVTFRVRAPESTPSMATLYVPGNLDALGPWDPGLLDMAPLGGGVWEATVDIPEGTALQYKYARGNWERVEWWGQITGLMNRSAVIAGESSALLVDNTSTAWDDLSVPDTEKGVRFWRDPLVASTAPASGAVVGVGAATAIDLTFERDIDPTGGSGYVNSVQVTLNGAPIGGSVAETAPGTMTFTPSQPFAAGAYQIAISEVMSSLGSDSVAMQAPYTFGFIVQ
jgi:alpha-glucosidase